MNVPKSKFRVINESKQTFNIYMELSGVENLNQYSLARAWVFFIKAFYYLLEYYKKFSIILQGKWNFKNKHFDSDICFETSNAVTRLLISNYCIHGLCNKFSGLDHSSMFENYINYLSTCDINKKQHMI